MSVFGYFNSKILGSKEGYITSFLVAWVKSYLYCEYPNAVPDLLINSTFSTVCTPLTPPIKFSTSDIIIGWFICHLSILK